MKKKAVAVMAVVALMCSMTACTGLTHCKECDDEVYEGGYCKYHYEINAAKEKVDSVGKDLFDMIGGDK